MRKPGGATAKQGGPIITEGTHAAKVRKWFEAKLNSPSLLRSKWPVPIELKKEKGRGEGVLPRQRTTLVNVGNRERQSKAEIETKKRKH